ncbi:MAG: hypothetical protein ACO3UM_13405, partial [Planctomycetota bacterium]
MNLRAAACDVRWSLWWIALIAVPAHVLLLLGLPIGWWLVPVAGLLAAALRRPERQRFDHPAVLGVVAIAALAIAYGSIATADRSWDGLATWTANARWLAVDGSLEQPYFRDPDVFHYARGYPLLQPILLALGMTWFGELGGRVLFPLLWLLLVTGLEAPLARAGLDPKPRRLAVLGLALVPIFIEPGGGGAASGFADLLVAALVLHAAVALAEDRPALAAVTGLLLPMAKTEGLVHVLILLGLAALAGRRQAAIGTALGAALGLALSVPLQQQIRSPDVALGWASLLPATLPFAVLGLGLALHARRTRRLALVATLVAPACLLWIGAFDRTVLGQTLQNFARLDLAFEELPAIAGQGVLTLVQVRKLGLTFVLAAATVVVVSRRCGLGSLRPLLAALLLAGTAILLFLADRPPEAIDLFLREGMVRYTAQWTGVAWLLIGLGWARLAAHPGPVSLRTPAPR